MTRRCDLSWYRDEEVVFGLRLQRALIENGYLRQAADRSRLRGALFATDQHATDLRSHRTQHQRQPQPVVADDGAERIVGRHDCSDSSVSSVSLRARSIGTCGMPSSRNSSPSRTKPWWVYMSSR